MQYVRDTLFASIVALLLFSVIAVLLLGLIPGFEAPSKSVLEGRTYTAIPDMTASSIANGTAQSELESYVADKVPMRDTVLLGNAAIQRSLIRVANVHFVMRCIRHSMDRIPSFLIPCRR